MKLSINLEDGTWAVDGEVSIIILLNALDSVKNNILNIKLSTTTSEEKKDATRSE